MQNGLPVAGYKPQPQSAVDLVNRNKEAEERVLRILDDLKFMPDVDVNWLYEGRRMIEAGFMHVNRAVFRPGRVALPEDACTCIACGVPLKDGDPFYEDANEGPMHAGCCGPEPESFVDESGEPLKAGDPIPAPGVFRT